MSDAANADDFGRITDGSTLVMQRWLPGPADRIWRYIVDSDLRRQWLAAGDMDLTPGSPVELVWRNDALSETTDPRPHGFPEENRLQSRVIAADPPRRLTIAWGEGHVTFDLKEEGEKVLLTLTHTGLGDRDTRTMVAAGWHTHLDILAARASGTTAPSFWSDWATHRAAYEGRLPR